MLVRDGPRELGLELEQGLGPVLAQVAERELVLVPGLGFVLVAERGVEREHETVVATEVEMEAALAVEKGADGLPAVAKAVVQGPLQGLVQGHELELGRVRLQELAQEYLTRPAEHSSQPAHN